ncbi:Hypothetical_protein [Hexamita inflata]|uniref:Hypothetical_protein n=1 Tax=Hexamita inflata TaxID=28002 RepID=A0AA86PD72_9EUKA|nr:Hypothetical protein HINF_LOCUS24470 [Hexamita inflata]
MEIKHSFFHQLVTMQKLNNILVILVILVIRIEKSLGRVFVSSENLQQLFAKVELNICYGVDQQLAFICDRIKMCLESCAFLRYAFQIGSRCRNSLHSSGSLNLSQARLLLFSQPETTKILQLIYNLEAAIKFNSVDMYFSEALCCNGEISVILLSFISKYANNLHSQRGLKSVILLFYKYKDFKFFKC